MANFVCIEEIKEDQINNISEPIQESNHGPWVVSVSYKAVVRRFYAFNTLEEAQALYDKLRGKEKICMGNDTKISDFGFNDHPRDKINYKKPETYKFSETNESVSIKQKLDKIREVIIKLDRDSLSDEWLPLDNAITEIESILEEKE